MTIEPEIWEPGTADPLDDVRETVTDSPALIVANVDLAIWVVPPNVRLQLDVVEVSAPPMFCSLNVQTSGFPEQEATSART
jgi:hypothetical protein